MTKRYYTVVFEITDEEAWKNYGPQFSQSLLDEEPLHTGVTVIACGEGDSMTEADALRECLVEEGKDPDVIVAEYLEIALGEEGSFPGTEEVETEVRRVLG